MELLLEGAAGTIMVSANTKKGKTLEVKWVDFVNVGTLYLNRYSGFKTLKSNVRSIDTFHQVRVF